MKPHISGITARRFRVFLLGAIVLSIFALYAGTLQLLTFHDDITNIRAIADRSIIQLFDVRPYGTGYYRPMSFVPWVVTRDVIGWFHPVFLHLWNLSCHVLNTLLVATLASRLGRLFGLRSTATPVLAALTFGLFPFSYQSVLWAGALPHPLATVFGLLALHAYLTWRTQVQRGDRTNTRRRAALIILSFLLLVAALLSHEQGFVFGVFMIFLELCASLGTYHRPFGRGLALGSCTMAYAVIYPVLLRPAWMNISGQAPGSTPEQIMASLSYQAQGMVVWLIILLRDRIGLPDTRQAIVCALLALFLSVGLVLLWRMRLLRFGLLALCWWLVAIAPSVFLLAPEYVLVSPRLMYVSSTGVALFYAVLGAGAQRALRRRPMQAVVLLLTVPLFVWCASYIAEWLAEVSRFPAALRQIDRDLQGDEHGAGASILLINTPSWVTPAVPPFLVGTESLNLISDEMLASVSNARFDERFVRHGISMTPSNRYQYAVAGHSVDDTGLRAAILRTEFVYRFDYDPPGMRVRRLGVIRHGQDGGRVLARLARGELHVTLRDARANRCGGHIQLQLTWSEANTASQPVGIFVHGLDVQGNQLLTADQDVLEGYLPLDLLPPSVTVSETRLIEASQAAGLVTKLAVGVYTRSDVRRLTATRADGQPLEGDSVEVPVVQSPDPCR